MDAAKWADTHEGKFITGGSMINTCDEITCSRVGTLSAYGWSDDKIADALLLNKDQVAWAKTTQQYAENYHRYTVEKAEKAITRAEGWDFLEDKALEVVATALDYHRDPRFALQVAKVANQAHRRASGPEKVIDATKPNSVINLTLNANFISKKITKSESGDSTNAVIDIKPREHKILPKRQSDVPTPQAVSNLLAPARAKLRHIEGAEFLESFTMDVVPDDK